MHAKPYTPNTTQPDPTPNPPELNRAKPNPPHPADALDRHLADLRRLGVEAERAHLNCGDMLWVARSRAHRGDW